MEEIRSGTSPSAGTGSSAPIGNVSQRAHQAIDKATDAAGRTAKWLGQKQQSLKESQQKLMQDTSAYVSANPLKAVGIAAAAGLVLSRLLFGRKHH